jgi:hypothetical protein
MPFQPFTGPARLNEMQRMGITAGMSMIPIVGAPAAAIYQLLRAGNAAYQGIGKMRGLTPGQLPTDAETNNPPQYGPAAPADAPAAGTTQAAGPRGGISMGDRYNAARGAFSPTFQQIMFPGSAIGSIQGRANQYNPAIRQISGWDTSIPSFALNNMAEVRKRNQL